MTDFRQLVFDIVAQIPKGKVSTYQNIAKMIGKPRAYRAVGNTLNQNYNKNVPCHRVIRSNGQVGGFRGGTKKKIAILKQEGVAIKNKTVDLDVFDWNFS